LAESVATLVPFESPQGTLVESPEKDKETSQNESSEDFVVVSGSTSRAPSEATAERTKETSAPSTSGKNFLSRGRIDAKAQDDFIAFMMGKK